MVSLAGGSGADAAVFMFKGYLASGVFHYSIDESHLGRFQRACKQGVSVW